MSSASAATDDGGGKPAAVDLVTKDKSKTNKAGESLTDAKPVATTKVTEGNEVDATANETVPEAPTTETATASAAAPPATAPAATSQNESTAAMNNNNDGNASSSSIPYWEDEEWIPTTKNGRQRTPNMIRNELQRHMDKSSETQRSFIRRLKVNNKSFRNFMNPNTYKDQWSAVQNGTYWAAARLLEEERVKKQTKKRKLDGNSSESSPKKVATAKEEQNVSNSTKPKTDQLKEAREMIDTINRVQGVQANVVYDTCQEVLKKIKDFLEIDGVTKKDFCENALYGVNYNSLSRFMSAKRQDQAGNVVYRRAYSFFERKRILENKSKSDARLKNELEHPNGFPLQNSKKSTLHHYIDPPVRKIQPGEELSQL